MLPKPTMGILPSAIAALLLSNVLGRRATNEETLEPGLQSSVNESSESCLDCYRYQSADRYEDDWRRKSGLEQTAARLEMRDDADLTDAEKLEDFGLRWTMTVHSIVETLQAQGCMDLCAVCALQPLEQQASALPSLKTIHIERNKNELDLGLWPVIGLVDVALGVTVNTLIGLPVTLASFFIGGSVTGTVVGGMAGAKAAGALASFGSLGLAAGNVLGALAGLATGAVSGAVLASVVEIFYLAKGLWKGVDLTGSLTHCSRVGFERFASGESLDEGTSRKEQPFRNIGLGPYGLKRLRESIPEESLSEADAKALSHCERVREHHFDMRHADECLRHSQLCGPSGGLMVPAASADMCQWISQFDNVYKDAISFANQTSLSLFSEWLKYENLLKTFARKEIKKEMCASIRCELGGGLDKEKIGFITQNIPSGKGASSQQKLILNALGNLQKFVEGCEVQFGMIDCEERDDVAS